MKDVILTVFWIVFLMLGLPILILWIRDKISEPSQEEMEEYSRRFRERLMNPDFEAVAKYFRHTLPQAIVELYQNQEELMRGDFKIALSKDSSEDEQWYIGFYMPADAEAVQLTWPGVEKFFAFANDGCGNDYIVDPTLDDPPVKFHDHETGEIIHVCDTLSQFMTWSKFEVD